MDVALIILAVICLIVGLVGCIVPMLPGPPIAYVAMLLLHFTDVVQFSWTQMLIWLALVVIVQLLDFVVPMLGTKYTGGSKAGEWGCFVGVVVGLFYMPWGIIVGPFVGAVIGELIARKPFGRAFLSGLGSFIGFLVGTGLKLLLCLYFVFEFVCAFF